MRLTILAAGLSLVSTLACADERSSDFWAEEASRAPQRHMVKKGPQGALELRPPVQIIGQRMIEEAQRYVGATRSPTGFRGPWCGDFVGFVADRVGARKPPAYRVAAAWRDAGQRLSQPVVGSIGVLRHHVGIVVAVRGSQVILLSGNHSHRVAEGVYATRRFIAFVQPS